MGFMHGTITHKNGYHLDVGYGVPTMCCEPSGCTEIIDRGMAYLCGSEHGGRVLLRPVLLRQAPLRRPGRTPRGTLHPL